MNATSARLLTEQRLSTVNPDDLKRITSLSFIGGIFGLNLPDDPTAMNPAIFENNENLALLGDGITAQERLESSLMSGDLDGVYIEQSTVLTVAAQHGANALLLYGSALAMASLGLPGAVGVVYEAGSCPNNTPDCPVNGYADALYALAKEAGEKYGVKVPDLGLTERRFSNADDARAYVITRMMDAITTAIGNLGGNAGQSFGVPERGGDYGGGVWN